MAEFLPHSDTEAVNERRRLTTAFYNALRRTIAALNDADVALSERQRETLAILNALGADDVESLEALGPLLDSKQDASEVLDALAELLTDGIVVKHGPTAYGRSVAGTANQITVANGSGTGGNPTVSLADLADSGTGTFKLLTRDAKGRLSGTADGTTTNVPEGTNLYFTDTRARTAAVADSITDGVTNIAPSQNAVFDAQAGKVAKAGDEMAGNLGFPVGTGITFPGSLGTAEISGLSSGVVIDYDCAITSGTDPFVARYFRNTNTTGACAFQFHNGNGAFSIQHNIDGKGTSYLCANAGNLGVGTSSPTAGKLVVAGNYAPSVDNTYSSGTATNRHSVVYAGTGAINTSDAREKRVRGPLTKPEIAAAREIKAAVVMYQWNDAIALKGEDARLHCSPTVQAVIGIMEKHGLDPFRYGFVCYDKWDETPEVVEDGEVVQEYRPAGDRYSLRPTELLFFIMAAL